MSSVSRSVLKRFDASAPEQPDTGRPHQETCRLHAAHPRSNSRINEMRLTRAETGFRVSAGARQVLSLDLALFLHYDGRGGNGLELN
jgi:hypothetical protein